MTWEGKYNIKINQFSWKSDFFSLKYIGEPKGTWYLNLYSRRWISYIVVEKANKKQGKKKKLPIFDQFWPTKTVISHSPK